jgi:beta-alanine--pyruvate transaminase
LAAKKLILWDNDLMVRVAGDTLVLTPPLIITEEVIEKVTKVIRATA